MNKLDPKIVDCLNNDLFRELLAGEPKCFVYDAYYRGHHDLLLVVATMIKWAIETKQVELVKSKIIEALSDILRTDIVLGLDIINSYFILAKDPKLDLQINFMQISKYLKEGLRNIENKSNEDKAKIDSLILSLSKKTKLLKDIGVTP